MRTALRTAGSILVIALAGCDAITAPDATEPEETLSWRVEIESISCTYSHTDGFLNRYYIIAYAGTATASEGMLLHLSTDGTPTKYTVTCGGWTSFVWGGLFPGCERKPGQPETISWSARSDPYIWNQTYRQQASLWHPKTGELGKLFRSIRCLS